MTITIPRKLIQNDDIVIVPKKEYEKLFRFWSSAEPITRREKKAIEKGFREIRDGKFFISREVKKGLGL